MYHLTLVVKPEGTRTMNLAYQRVLAMYVQCAVGLNTHVLLFTHPRVVFCKVSASNFDRSWLLDGPLTCCCCCRRRRDGRPSPGRKPRRGAQTCLTKKAATKFCTDNGIIDIVVVRSTVGGEVEPRGRRRDVRY